MRVYIYDIEVFSDDWIVVFRNPEAENNHIVIHNDNHHLRAFIDQPDIVIGGFNNKHYDDWVVLTMLNGGSNVEVKKANDFIIGGGKGWEIPFIQYQKKPFKSFDLRDDIADKGISLKAIEGNLKLPIVESSVPFDIDRPLTPEELEEVIRYCKYDVDSTVRLYWERKKDYLDAKILAGSIYGIDPVDALGYTNAKLSAEALRAKYVERSDERDYKIPDRLDPERIPKLILDFFMQITDKSIPDAKLFGAGKGSKGMTLKLWLETSVGRCPVTYAWGGVHGAKPCVTIEETEDRVIINQDVGSLYPNSMINFGYTSRSMEDPDAYKKLVELRLDFKSKAKATNKKIADKIGGSWYHEFSSEDADGNTFLDMEKVRAGTDPETYNLVTEYLDYDAKQSSLKLIINTCYGAMLATGNGLNDRLGGRSVCITNQLAMTILIADLCKRCETIDFVNINTDGIMFTIDRKEVDLSEEIVEDWCKLTGFTMERDDFYKVTQKDVNNYIGIYKDGHFKTKGGYVSLYDGGNFKTNSLQIIHKAIVDKLVKNIDPEVTIRECTDVTAFQQIIKTGGTYEGSYHYVNGIRENVQKVNRVYAVKNPIYGQVVKGKWITEKRKKNPVTGKMDSIPVDPPVWSETVISECPDHCYIDNENTLTIDDLDLDYYIDMANSRVDKYINIDRKVENELKKIKEVVSIMATQTKTASAEKRNVYQKLAEARARFLEAPVKKSGINRFAEYKYFELEDIVPPATSIFNDLGLIFIVSFEEGYAVGRMIDTEDPDQVIIFKSPFIDLTVGDKAPAGMNSVQALGGSETYQRRYLYMIALDIVEADAFDKSTGKPDPKEEAPAVAPVKKSNRPASESERQEVKKDLIDKDGEATDTQVKAIKAGLKKLRSKDSETYEAYIGDVVKRLKAGIKKTEAEDLLIEIGEKVEE